MKYTEDHMNEKPLFVIEEKLDVIEGQTEGETPVITIEEAPSDSPGGEFINVERDFLHICYRGLEILSHIYKYRSASVCNF